MNVLERVYVIIKDVINVQIQVNILLLMDRVFVVKIIVELEAFVSVEILIMKLIKETVNVCHN